MDRLGQGRAKVRDDRASAGWGSASTGGRRLVPSHRAPRILLTVGLCAALLAAIAGCGQQAEAAGASVRVLGSWTGSEADAFQRVLAPFEQRTGIRVDYTTTRDLRGAIDDALGHGQPFDVVGLEGPAHLRELASAGALKDLGGVIDLQQYKQWVAPTFVELGSVDGELLGVFLKATVKGLIWYNPAVFRQGNPGSFADLGWMADRYVGARTRQWCVGLASRESSGWPGTDLIESFLIHQSGVPAYDRWVEGQLPWTSPEVRQAFLAYGRVVADDAVAGGAQAVLSTAFEKAGDPLFSDPPGCLFLHQGSFMPSFWDADGLVAGVDYDFMPFPPMNERDRGSVIGAGDLFGMLTDTAPGRQLMRYLVSRDAQEILVAQGGALSVDVRVSTYPNDLVRREAAVLTTAQHFRFDASDLMPPALNHAFWQAVLDFTADQSQLDQVLQRLEEVRANDGG